MSAVSWLLYSGLVGALLTLAAWQGSRAATRRCQSARWVWVAAALATTAFPLRALLTSPAASNEVFPLGPEWEWPRSVAVIHPSDGPEEAHGGPRWSGFSPRSVALVMWALTSMAALGWVVLSQRRLGRQRSGWDREALLGVPVRVAPDFGPAVVGIRKPEIVVPRWVLTLPDESLSLILRHETEHLRGHDSRLLALLVGLIVLLPWQPFLWLQLGGLRLAIELDCDRRVLAKSPGVRRYAALLLEVAGRGAGVGAAGVWRLPLAMLWARPSQLERRLSGMLTPPVSGLARNLMPSLSGAAIAALACATRPPAAVPTPMDSPEAIEQARLEPILSRYFATPAARSSPDSVPIYWLVSERNGSVVRHATGGKDIIWRSGEWFRKDSPEMYQRLQAHADSFPSDRGVDQTGVLVLTDSVMYRRFPDLGERRLYSYGLSRVAFGKDSVTVAWGELVPR